MRCGERAVVLEKHQAQKSSTVAATNVVSRELSESLIKVCENVSCQGMTMSESTHNSHLCTLCTCVVSLRPRLTLRREPAGPTPTRYRIARRPSAL